MGTCEPRLTLLWYEDPLRRPGGERRCKRLMSGARRATEGRGIHINGGLLALGKVISALCDREEGKSAHAPTASQNSRDSYKIVWAGPRARACSPASRLTHKICPRRSLH